MPRMEILGVTRCEVIRRYTVETGHALQVFVALAVAPVGPPPPAPPGPPGPASYWVGAFVGAEARDFIEHFAYRAQYESDTATAAGVPPAVPMDMPKFQYPDFGSKNVIALFPGSERPRSVLAADAAMVLALQRSQLQGWRRVIVPGAQHLRLSPPIADRAGLQRLLTVPLSAAEEELIANEPPAEPPPPPEPTTPADRYAASDDDFLRRLRR